MYKSKNELNLTKKFVQTELKKFVKEVKKAGLTVKTSLYVDENEDKKGNIIYKWDINTCYRLTMYLATGAGADKTVRKTFKKSELGKYFAEGGSGAGFGYRDIGFYQKKKIPVDNL